MPTVELVAQGGCGAKKDRPHGGGTRGGRCGEGKKLWVCDSMQSGGGKEGVRKADKFQNFFRK